MGGADIRVPEDLQVELSEFAFMGGNSVKPGTAPPRPGGPVLRLRLISIMGGSDVKRGPKLCAVRSASALKQGGAATAAATARRPPLTPGCSARRGRIQSTGATTITVAPMASAATPIESSAKPPISAAPRPAAPTAGR